MGGGKRGSHLVPWWLPKQTTSVITEMASQPQGIQQLLQAEKRAAEKVADARKSESHFVLRNLERKLGVERQQTFESLG